MKLKKVVYIFLLLLLVLQSGGLFLVLKSEQYAAQISMQHRIMNDTVSAEILTLSCRDYEKSLVDRKEIYYHGRMYDIRSMEKTGDSVRLVAVHDVKEGNILKKIKKLFPDNNTKHRQAPKHLMHLMTLNYIAFGVHPDDLILHFQILKKFSVAEHIISGNPEVLTPPPKSV